VPGYAEIVSPITDLVKGDQKSVPFGKPQEAAILKIALLFTSGKIPVLRHFDQDRPAQIQTDAPDFALGAVLSQTFEHGIVYPCEFLSRKCSQVEFNYDVFDKEILPIIYAFQNSKHFLQGLQF